MRLRRGSNLAMLKTSLHVSNVLLIPLFVAYFSLVNRVRGGEVRT